MKEDDKEWLCGKLLVDFANSKSIDEAALEYLINIQKIFNFSKEFIKTAQQIFPKQDTFIHSDRAEDKITILMAREKRLSFVINRYLYPAHFQYFDYLNKSISVGEYDRDEELRGARVECPGKVYLIEELSPEALEELCEIYIMDSLPFDGEEEDKVRILSNIKSNMDNYLQIQNDLFEYKQQTSKEIYSLVQENALSYYRNSIEYDHIEELQGKLETLFQAIIDEDGNTVLEIIRRFIETYNSIPVANASISNDGKINISERFQEDLFLRNKGGFTLQSYYDEPISYCIVTYFKYDRSYDLIKKCEKCCDFYIPLRLKDGLRFCSDKCRLNYHNSKRSQSELNEYKREKRKQGADYY